MPISIPKRFLQILKPLKYYDQSSKGGDKGIKWAFSKGAKEVLPLSFWDNPREFIQAFPQLRIIKDSLTRKVTIISLPTGAFLVKDYKIKGRGEVLKYLLVPSRAQREWVMGIVARRRRVPIPSPLAMGERRKWGILKEAFFVAEAIVPSIPFTELSRTEIEGVYFPKAAQLLRRMHQAGIFHKDLHAGNILIQKERRELFLIDLHRSTFSRTIPERKRLWNIAQLFLSLEGKLSRESKRSFLAIYNEGGDLLRGDYEDILKKIEKIERRIWYRHMRSRTKRCLKNSTGFYTLKGDGWKVWARREWEVGDLFEIMKAHEAIMRGEAEGLIKRDRRTAISSVDFRGRRIYVKEFIYPNLKERLKDTFRGVKGLKAWIGGNGLLVRGVDVGPVAFLLQRRALLPSKAFLFMSADEGYRDLKEMISSAEGSLPKKKFLEKLADFIVLLFERGIVHRDLKARNILVAERGGGWRFSLTDWEDVRFRRRASRRDVIRALVQLNTSIPLSLVGWRDRVYFLGRFLDSLGEGDRTSFYKEIAESSEKRGYDES